MKQTQNQPWAPLNVLRGALGCAAAAPSPPLQQQQGAPSLSPPPRSFPGELLRCDRDIARAQGLLPPPSLLPTPKQAQVPTGGLRSPPQQRLPPRSSPGIAAWCPSGAAQLPGGA